MDRIPEQGDTKARILESAEREFLGHGFSAASLRAIAAGAGVTTGALYRHFAGKADLFDALVSPSFHGFLDLFRRSADESSEVLRQSDSGIDWSSTEKNLLRMTAYIYDHLSAFRLLLSCAEKTAYESFTHMLIDMEVEMTKDYMATARELGHVLRDIPEEELHILINAQFSAFFELVLHDVPRERAMEYTTGIYRFFEAGWRVLFLGE